MSYEGEASYWHLDVDGYLAEDAGWTYPDPIAGCPPLQGYVSFYLERFDPW